MDIIDGFKSFLRRKKSSPIKNDNSQLIEAPEKLSITPTEGNPTINPEIQDYFDEISDDGWCVEISIGTIGDKRDNRYSDGFGKECVISIKTSAIKDLESKLDNLKLHLNQSTKRLISSGFQLNVGKHGNGIVYIYDAIRRRASKSYRTYSIDIEENITNNIQFDKIKNDLLSNNRISSFVVKIFLL